MKICPNNHQNDDSYRFCETCGTMLPDQPVAVDPDRGSTAVEMDLIVDDAAIVSDVVDVDIVPEDETSLADPVDGPDGNDVEDEDEDSDDVDDATDDDGNGSDIDDEDDDTDASGDADPDDDDDSAVPSATPLYSPTALAATMSQVKSWAAQWDVADDPFITGLDEAVATNNDLGMWSSVDPAQMLPDMPDQTTIFHRLGRIFAVVRNVLVFTPVALTWLAIYKATSAYSTWAGEDATYGAAGTKQKNFLDFWANGYGELSKAFTLPEIGKVDFGLIMLVIVLSLASSVLVARGEAENDRLRSLFEKERTKLAIAIKRALHGKREASPASIASSLADALADLNQTTRDMAEVAARLETATVGVSSLTPQIEKLNDHAGTFAVQTSASIATAVQQLVSSVDALNDSVSSNVTSAFQTAVASLQEAGEQLAKTSASLEYGTKLLKDDIETIRKGLRR